MHKIKLKMKIICVCTLNASIILCEHDIIRFIYLFNFFFLQGNITLDIIIYK